MRFTLNIGTYAGIPVKLHATFPLILAVFGVQAWFASGWFSALLTSVTILAMFLFVVLHEYGHALMIRRYGIPVKDIILLPIGGMARAERIPEKPAQEIKVAIAGPAVNLVLALVFLVAMLLVPGSGAANDTMANFCFINILLAVFNMVPAFPMDGGRVLRGLLALRLPYLRATSIARGVGQLIALAFVVLGFVNSTFIILPVIAAFIFIGGAQEEQQIRVRAILGERVLRDVVPGAQVAIAPHTAVQDALAAMQSRQLQRLPIVDDEEGLRGVVTVEDARRAVAGNRGEEAVSGFASDQFLVFDGNMPASRAYYFLRQQRARFAAVVDGPVFLGMVHTDAMLTPS